MAVRRAIAEAAEAQPRHTGCLSSSPINSTRPVWAQWIGPETLISQIRMVEARGTAAFEWALIPWSQGGTAGGGAARRTSAKRSLTTAIQVPSGFYQRWAGGLIIIAAVKIALALALATCFGASLRSQTFEVASIKESTALGHGGSCSGGPETISPGIFNCHNESLANLVYGSYHVKPWESAMPAWMQESRFDITAKVPAGTTKEQFRLMQQNLLKESFKLTAHNEPRETPVYEVTVAKSGLRMKASAPAPAEEQPAQSREPLSRAEKEQQLVALKRATRTDRDGFPIPAGPSGFVARKGRVVMNQNYTIPELTTFLSSQVDRPMVDATGLKGRYQVKMHWVQDWASSASGTALEPIDGPTLFRAMVDQLGLTVEAKKGRLNILVVDSAVRVPIRN
jgi:uncharacterized protein (TIGR03435 family)